MQEEQVGNIGTQIGDMILHHVTNSAKLEVPLVSKAHAWAHAITLPKFPAFEIFGLTVDLSITKHVAMMMLAALLLITLAFIVRRKRIGLIPKGIVNLVEMIVVFVRDDIATTTLGKKAAMRYTPYLCTTFFFILTCNLLGLIPYCSTATGNIGVTAALAFMSFLMIQGSGIRKMGLWGYARHIVPSGIPIYLAPIMFVVELMGIFTKPFALCIRLFANMIAGHMVILSLIGLIFIFGVWMAPISSVFCVFLYLLELLIVLLQSYIFTILTSLFIGLVIEEEH